ncbi:MAG: recombinase family protein [Aromatoleum sp.]|jgi:putative DNA-invertase from lambdoid prophage Rac|uniref:recombinase family protein n=1 Tax=Aromatoleum sp. TaxID=2307007 RepID=UPI002894C938|nr:recombinase family protein [Aromatoleum sp.]MDT3670870.1 recombinase family protein [Aromatoleum sp.]
MTRVFAYCRVSTASQTTDNQALEISSAGFVIEAQRIITECISGSTQALRRPGFKRLLDRLERGDVLVVTKLDRLGRNAMDVRASVEWLANAGVRVHCLALGGVDLTSSAGRMTMQVIAAVAEFERDLLVERTHQGLARARKQGKALGRPAALSETERFEAIEKLKAGVSVAEIARTLKTSRQTIMRLRATQGAQGPT